MNEQKPEIVNEAASAQSALNVGLAAGTLFNTPDGEHMIVRKDGDNDSYWCINPSDKIKLESLFCIQAYSYSRQAIIDYLAANVELSGRKEKL